MKKITLFILVLLTLSVSAQENCAGVVDLGTLPNPYNGNTTGAVNDFGQDCLTNAGAPDQVFSISVPDGQQLTIGQSSNSYDSKHRVAYGATCPGDQLITCTDDPDTSTVIWLNSTGSTQTVYWVQSAFSTGSGAFTLQWSIEAPAAPPANDECANAETLIVNSDLNCGTVTSGTIEAATDSGVTGSTCGGTDDDDVWYAFQASSTNHVISLTNVSGSTSDLYHAVYDASSGCASLGAALVCSDPNTSTVTGLTVGNFYLVQVYTWTANSGQNTTFDICVGTPPPPPVNDECGNAISLTMSTDSSCNNSLSGTTNSALPSSSGCTGGRDVWYSFTPASDGDYIASVTETFESASFISTYIAVFEGSCGSLTQIGSSTSCFNTGNITFSAIAGTTYYYAVRSSSTTGYTEFDVCTYPVPPPPVNDACAGAITINSGDSISGSTVGATNVEQLPACSGGDVGSSCDPSGDSTPNQGFLVFGIGVWYVYNSPGGESISVGDSANSFDSEIQVFSGSCGNLVCVAGDDDSEAGNGGFVCFDAPTAETYYIYVDGNASTGTGSYTLNLNTIPLPPANDDCADAEVITFGNEVSASNTGATDSNVTGTCFTGNIRDVWYSAVADATGEIYVNSLTAGFQYAIYSDCSGTEVSCNAGATGLTDGSTYYIRITDDGTGTTRASGAFSFTPSTMSLSANDFDSELGFTYYPNPVKNTLTLDAQQNIETVVMYNMLGQEVLRLSPNSVSATVDMSNLNTGAYFATVSILGNTETVRVIKQ